MKKLIGIILLGFMLSACGERTPSSDQMQRNQQEQLSAEANAQVGMPAIVNFQEKRTMKTILELRDKTITTVTYTQDMNGNLHKLCDSVGYGLPYATQYTNPQRVANYHETPDHGNVTLPAADPNGLFSPPSADGTWILCLDPSKKGGTMPVYVEPRVIVSTFPLK